MEKGKNKTLDFYAEYYLSDKNYNLLELAKIKKVNPKLLAILNGLEVQDMIYKDQMVLIPKNSFSYYITKKGDTLKSVSDIFNTAISDIIINNETIYLNEGQLLVNGIK